MGLKRRRHIIITMASLDYNRPDVRTCYCCFDRHNKSRVFADRSGLSRHKNTKKHKENKARWDQLAVQAQFGAVAPAQNQAINAAPFVPAPYMPPVRNLHSDKACNLNDVWLPDDIFETPNIADHVRKKWRSMPQSKRPIIYDGNECEWHVKVDGEWKVGKEATDAVTDYFKDLVNAAGKIPAVREGLFSENRLVQSKTMELMNKFETQIGPFKFKPTTWETLTDRMLSTLTYK